MTASQVRARVIEFLEYLKNKIIDFYRKLKAIGYMLWVSYKESKNDSRYAFGDISTDLLAKHNLVRGYIATEDDVVEPYIYYENSETSIFDIVTIPSDSTLTEQQIKERLGSDKTLVIMRIKMSAKEFAESLA